MDIKAFFKYLEIAFYTVKSVCMYGREDTERSSIKSSLKRSVYAPQHGDSKNKTPQRFVFA